MLEVFRKVAFRFGGRPRHGTTVGMEKDVIGRPVGAKGSKQPAILEECMREVCVTTRWHQNSQLVIARVMNFINGTRLRWRVGSRTHSYAIMPYTM